MNVPLELHSGTKKYVVGGVGAQEVGAAGPAVVHATLAGGLSRHLLHLGESYAPRDHSRVVSVYVLGDVHPFRLCHLSLLTRARKDRPTGYAGGVGAGFELDFTSSSTLPRYESRPMGNTSSIALHGAPHDPRRDPRAHRLHTSSRADMGTTIHRMPSGGEVSLHSKGTVIDAGDNHVAMSFPAVLTGF
jgi:hypothetical protein